MYRNLKGKWYSQHQSCWVRGLLKARGMGADVGEGGRVCRKDQHPWVLPSPRERLVGLGTAAADQLCSEGQLRRDIKSAHLCSTSDGRAPYSRKTQPTLLVSRQIPSSGSLPQPPKTRFGVSWAPIPHCSTYYTAVKLLSFTLLFPLLDWHP